MIIVAVGGGFDPLHKGHIRMFQQAKQLGDKLIVILNNDKQLIKKKGKTFYPIQEERKQILEAIKYIDEVIINPDEDLGWINIMESIKPNIWIQGPDKTIATMPKIELITCARLGIKIITGLGDPEAKHSSELAK